MFDEFLTSLEKKVIRFLPEDRQVVNKILASIIIFVSFPKLMESNGIGVDPSWEMFLHWAYENNILYGKDVIFTYGPLGFITKPLIGFQDFPFTVFFRLLIYCLWWIGTIKILYSIKDKFHAFIYFLITIISFAYRDITIILLLTVITYQLISFSSGRSLWGLPAYIISAATLLIKFNIGITSLFLISIYSICYIFKYKAKSLPGILIGLTLYTITLFGFFYALQRTFDVKNFLFASWNLAKDFSTNFGTGVSYVDLFFGFVVIIVIGRLLFEQKEFKNFLYLTFSFSIILFITFKGSFVRGDKWHLLNFFLLLGAMTINLLVFPVFQQKKSVKLLILIQLVCSLWLVTHFNILKWINPLAVLKVKEAVLWKYSIRQIERENKKFYKIQKLSDTFLSKIRRNSIDAYPWDVGRILTNNLNYSPSYVILSYHAINPKLDSITSIRYSNSGPQFILMSFRYFDEFHPSVLDAGTFIEIWRNYKLVEKDSNCLLLQKSDIKRFSEKVVTESKFLNEGEAFYIKKHNAPLILKADFSMTIYGKIAQLLYKSKLPKMEITYKDGTKTTFNIPWKNMRQGFLVNNIPRNLKELEALYRDQNKAEVSSIKFLFDTNYYQKQIPIIVEQCTSYYTE